MATDSEETPAKKQTMLDLIFSELNEMKVLCQRSADSSFSTNEMVKGIVARVQTLEHQRAADRMSWYWAPLLISSVAFCGMIWLAFKFGHG